MSRRFADKDTPSFPIDIVLLLQDLEFGGTQRYALTLLKTLDRTMFSPRLWVLRGGKDMVPIAEELGIRPVWMSNSSYVGPWALGNLVRRLFAEPPHILYTLTVVPNIWGRLFGALARVPVIVSGWRDLFPNQHERWMWRLSTRIICNARVLKHVIVTRCGVDPKRIAVVPNAVDHDFFLPDHSQETLHPTILFVGRLVEDKDPWVLVEAFQLLLYRIPEVRLQIIGNGKLRSKLQSFLGRRGLETRVDLHPGVKDIRPFLRQSWVLVMTSRREASPNVILEAMSSELPVVATRVGGIPELVDEGETGLLVEPGNPKAVAEALERILTDERLRRDFGKKGREKIQRNHSLELMVRKTEEVLVAATRDVFARVDIDDIQSIG